KSSTAAWASGATGSAAAWPSWAGAPHPGPGSSQAGTGAAAVATLGGSGDDSGADELAPRLTLLVESRAGYRNLCRLLSAAGGGAPEPGGDRPRPGHAAAAGGQQRGALRPGRGQGAPGRADGDPLPYDPGRGGAAAGLPPRTAPERRRGDGAAVRRPSRG